MTQIQDARDLHARVLPMRFDQGINRVGPIGDHGQFADGMGRPPLPGFGPDPWTQRVPRTGVGDITEMAHPGRGVGSGCAAAS